MARLGDICNILNGYAFKSENYVDKGIRVIRIANVQKGYIEDNTPQFYPENTDEDISKYMLYSGDLLLSLTGNVGRVAILTEAFLPAALNQRVACLRIKRQDVDKSYLYHYLNSDSFEHECIMSSKGVAQKNISTEWLKEYDVLLPPIGKQKHVVAVLDTLANLIFLREQQLVKLDELVKARFVEMFGDMLFNPQNWPEISLGELADIVSGITKGRKTQGNDLMEVPYMAVSNVKDGYIDWTTIKTIMATASEIEQYRLKPNDVLMTEGGDPDKLGRGAIIKEPLNNCIHQNHIFRVRLNVERVLPEFFAEYLQHPKAKRYFLRCAKQTTGIASINMKQLRTLPVLVPSIERQYQFASIIDQIYKSTLTIQQSLDKLKVLKKALMQAYFD